MASLVAGALQTTFAAVSFAVAGYLFKMFDKNGYEQEMKRHNLAMEELQKAREEFNEKEIKRNDRIRELRQQLSDTNADINESNKALDELKQIQSTDMQSKYKEPQLNYFYKPSDEMKEYQYLSTGIIGASAGYALFKFI